MLAFGLLLARIASGGTTGESGASGRAGSTQPGTSHAATSGPASQPPASSEAPPAPTGTVTISAVGDTMLGTTAEPAPSPGTYFNSVKSSIPADVAFANLEGTLTDQTSGKCATLPAGTCYEFELPPSYARYYKQAGFTMMSNGNNHAFDFWQAGLDDTVAALDHAGLDHTGRTTEITYVDVRGHPHRVHRLRPVSEQRAAQRLHQGAAADPQGRCQRRPGGGLDARRCGGVRRAAPDRRR